MIKIKKVFVGFPQKEVSFISISIITFKTDVEVVNTYWELHEEIITNVIDEEGNDVQNIDYPVLANGNYELTEKEYKAWGASNKIVEDCVLKGLGLERF
jgi:hypothetical protein